MLTRVLLALSSAVLLIISFPNFNQPWAAWVALVPWLILLRRGSRRAAFWWSWLIGFLFFLGSIWWLIHVTLIGWIVLCAYLALFFGLFGWFVGRFTLHASRFTVLLLIPSAWVALEYARSRLFSGFGWNLLAYSQTPWRPVIQVADLAGAWGVSFLVVMANTALALAVLQRRNRRQNMVRCAVAAGGVLAALAYGLERTPEVLSPQTARIAVVQGNIPQHQKWDAAFQGQILARYESLTQRAASTRPDLIVWPETAVPDYLGLEDTVTRRVLHLASQAGSPLLVGAPAQSIHGGRWSLRNSAMLIASGRIIRRYDKLHLVPFGEFIPGERWVPQLRDLRPDIGDFTPGTEYTVFELGSGLRAQGSGQLPRAPSPEPKALRFSVLICFEDVFPELARRFAQAGAQMLVVITNDGWFGPTAAAHQHAQASIFRAVELRVPVVRAANTGWSGCIDAAGRPISQVQDAAGAAVFVPGTATCEVPLRAVSGSVYQRLGDWFPWLCILVVLGTELTNYRTESYVN